MLALDAKPVDVVSAYKRHHRAGRGPQGFQPIIATMAKAEEGGRNALLNWAAYKMCTEGATSDDLTLLAEAAGHAGLSPREIERTIQRSDEQTAELQSLMRISYAVLCLKKHNTRT